MAQQYWVTAGHNTASLRHSGAGAAGVLPAGLLLAHCVPLPLGSSTGKQTQDRKALALISSSLFLWLLAT